MTSDLDAPGLHSASFGATLADEAELRRFYRQPSPLVVNKEIDHLDDHCRAFIAASTFVLLATYGADGRADVSPRGGPAGFVKVLDDRRLVLPDLNGNNRLDSLVNVVTTGRAGLLFLVPGLGETLRVNGAAVVTVDDDILDGFTDDVRRPTSAVGVAVDEAFIHCAKAIRRGGLWQPGTWPSADRLPSTSRMIIDHCHLDGVSVAEVDADMERGYLLDLAHDRPPTD